MECGKSLQALSMPHCGNESNRILRQQQDCDRTYWLYLPSALCNKDIEILHHETPAVLDILPTVFAFHCFGCTAETLMFWTTLAEEYQFVLVIPEGLQKSWNARHCCGYSLQNNVDDVGFVHQMIATLDANYDFISSSCMYALGWSNGGYMVTHAASLFRAIAPVSGHLYDLPLMNQQPIGLFMHHSLNDPFVQFTGCCTNTSMPQCCCGISSPATAPSTCTSAMQVFQSWSQHINHCTRPHEEWRIRTVASGGVRGNITCHSATGCRAVSTLCIHSTGGHFNRRGFERSFPMTKEIAEFFMEDACGIHNGTWFPQEQRCSCGTPHHEGRYCLVQKGSIAASSTPLVETSTTTAEGSMTVSPVYFLFALALLGALFGYKKRTRYSGWTRVAAAELEMQARVL